MPSKLSVNFSGQITEYAHAIPRNSVKRFAANLQSKSLTYSKFLA